MNVVTPFCVGIGISDLSSCLPLARKIFSENKHTFRDSGRNITNFWYQTLNKHAINENYFSVSDVEELKSSILEHGIEYLKQINWYIDFYEYEVTNLWLNEYKSDTYFQPPHSHPGFILSGTYYVDMPVNCNPIQFYSPFQNLLPSVMFPKGNVINELNFKYNQFNSTSWMFHPKEGEVFFWPSNLSHSVDNSKFNGVRRSIAFDINTKSYKRGF